MSTSARSVQAGSGTLLLILIQVSSRALTFIGNQFLLRFLSPSLLGISVQLELVSVTSLYFARDSLRVALQRQPPTPSTKAENKAGSLTEGDKSQSSRQIQTVVNLSYLSILLGLIICTTFGYSYRMSAPLEVTSSPSFTLSFQIYALATLIELLAEPFFIVIQQKALYAARARAETSAAMARCLFACIVAVLGHGRGWEPSILPFATGQLSYAVVLFSLYSLPAWTSSREDAFNLKPTPLPSSPPPQAPNLYYLSLIHKPLLALAGTMYMQSVFKLFLTQGDALILSFLSSLADQGAFALASNYGGLLARLVFQPVEESSRNTFGRLLSSPSGIDGPKDGIEDARKQQKQNSQQALSYLANTLHFYLLLALPLLSLAPYILPLLVRHILSARWYTPSTASLLSTYCYYIPFMAVNGILDAFVTSVATPAQLRQQSLWMMLFTAVYGGAGWALMTKGGLGATGLIAANMVNMGLRVLWCLYFIRTWIRDQENSVRDGNNGIQRKMMKEAMPSVASITTAGAITVGLKIYGTKLDTGILDREVLGVLVAGTVLLGSTM